ncbi:MAG: hypothetical protein ACREJO_02860 [Phycisphaerales bacterium]
MGLLLAQVIVLMVVPAEAPFWGKRISVTAERKTTEIPPNALFFSFTTEETKQLTVRYGLPFTFLHATWRTVVSTHGNDMGVNGVSEHSSTDAAEWRVLGAVRWVPNINAAAACGNLICLAVLAAGIETVTRSWIRARRRKRGVCERCAYPLPYILPHVRRTDHPDRLYEPQLSKRGSSVGAAGFSRRCASPSG